MRHEKRRLALPKPGASKPIHEKQITSEINAKSHIGQIRAIPAKFGFCACVYLCAEGHHRNIGLFNDTDTAADVAATINAILNTKKRTPIGSKIRREKRGRLIKRSRS